MHAFLCLQLASHPALSHSRLGVTVRYEEERYSVEEEAGYVTLALVLEGDTAIPVTVSVNTLDLLHSSVEDVATGKLVLAADYFRGFTQCSLQLAMWNDITSSGSQWQPKAGLSMGNIGKSGHS